MKAISLWQPWASLVVLGSKKIETRHWSTNYRGPLLIHAAKRQVKRELDEIFQSAAFRGALWLLPHGRESLPFGAIVGVVEMVDCKPVEAFGDEDLFKPQYPLDRNGRDDQMRAWREYDLGNFAPARYGWLFANPQKLDPIPYKGQQGFFEVEAW